MQRYTYVTRAQVLKAVFSGLFLNGADSLCDQEVIVKSTGILHTSVQYKYLYQRCVCPVPHLH